MRTKRIGLMLAILISMVATKAFAYDIAVENEDNVIIYYNYINGGKELEVSYYEGGNSKYTGVINIPEIVTYKNKTLKVTSIGNYAFNYSNIISVTIPNNVRIINDGAFRYCKRMSSANIGNGVTSIGDYAFYESGLSSVNIPISVISIGDHAFDGCLVLSSLTLPTSLKTIGDYAFQSCCFASLIIPNSVTSIGDYAFKGCYGITSLVLSSNIKTIGNYTFSGCSGLTSVTIPNNVTSIGKCAFSYCSNLRSIIIPNSVKTIKDNAFFQCKALKDVVISENVTDIGNGVFYYCDLERVVSKINDPFIIDDKTFSDNTYKNATLYVPSGAINKYKETKGWKSFLNIEEETTGIVNDIDLIRDVPSMIKAKDGVVSIEGADDNTTITAYTIDGVQWGSAVSKNGVATINTNVSAGTVTIVKIGNKSVKVVMK